MKKLFLFILLLLTMNVFSQITLDFQSSSHLFYFKLNNSETKYFDPGSIESANQIQLYNLNGSLFKTIQVPPNPNATIMRVDWISETLFDSDSSNIEYFVYYKIDSSSYIQYQAKIIREDGTILLDEINATPYYSLGGAYWDPMVFATEEGAKLMLDYKYANGWYYQIKVFNLPGKIPNALQDNIQKMNNILSIYPNPNNGSFFINLHSNEENSQMIDLYSTNGKLIDTYKSSGNQTQINNFGLSEGIYLLSTQSKGVISTAKMVIKK